VRHTVRGGRGSDGRDAGRRRQGRSPVAGRREVEQEEALISWGSGGWHGVVWAGDGGSGGQAAHAGSDERCGVGQSGGWDAQGRMSGVGSVSQAGGGRWGEGARGSTWLDWSVGLFGPGDGPLLHNPR
jgi:hypothetical protein